MGWACPLTKNPQCSEQHAIGLDGSLRHAIPDALMIDKGWKIVNFPKRAWYPEFDQTHPQYREDHIIDYNEDTDTLIEEKL